MPPGFPSYTPACGANPWPAGPGHMLDQFPALRRRQSPSAQVTTSPLFPHTTARLKEFPFIYRASARLEQAQCESKPDQFFSNPEIQLRGLPLESVRPWYSGRVTRVMKPWGRSPRSWCTGCTRGSVRCCRRWTSTRPSAQEEGGRREELGAIEVRRQGCFATAALFRSPSLMGCSWLALKPECT
ncbi:hypothetical protein RHGRI_031890 [Rhododendron griersonianum]|uniref:Uncharacterized protein n=1 Tax=Rhododendron griersonianum TaxID=479676 RepID=A0AAV6I9N8_9ERIC|nr:hypothetical protein RHGRI_031890 [Rhododendron griersonianum]